jgi:hypothetical protein
VLDPAERRRCYERSRVVGDEEAGSLTPGRRLLDLLLDPGQRRVGGTVRVDDSSRGPLRGDAYIAFNSVLITVRTTCTTRSMSLGTLSSSSTKETL